MMKHFTKRISSFMMLAAIAGLASGAVVERAQLAPARQGALPENKVTVAPAGMSAAGHDAPAGSRPARVKRDASGMTWTILIDEDFSGMTEGSIQEPSEERLCYYYGEPGMYIDPKYTQQPGWTGSNLFSAGGALLMEEVAQTVGAPLNTPLGDYSGNLTISFRYRIKPGYTKHSQIIVDVLKGGVEHPQIADCDYNFYAANVYPGQEDWKYAKVECRNLSADSDGFIQFNAYGAVIIDDIEITACNDFIASPVLKPITGFNPTSFTANWEPVRLASSYYVELQKKVYTSDETSVCYNEDFEDISSVPDGWEINNFSPERIVSEGSDFSSGLRMNNGDYVVTPYNMAKYKWLKMFGRLVVPEGFDIYSITGTVTFSLRTQDGWVKLSSAPAGWFYDPWAFDFGEELFPQFNNNYYGLKIEVDGLADDTYLVLDDFEFETGRPSKLESVISFDDYVIVRDGETSYTFTELDPESEYFYGVKSFYQGIYSEPVVQHAFGVSAPVMLQASDITATSYRANWEQAPKATGYNVYNYGVYTATSDITEYAVLEEDFSKINGETTWATSFDDPESLDNYTVTGLDEYTSLPGWTGLGNIVFDGALGVQDSYNTLYYIQTPPLSLDNDDSFVLSLSGGCSYDDQIVVWINQQAYRMPVTAGDFSGEFEIPEHGDNITIMFYAATGTPFYFDFVGIYQDLKAGQKVFTYLSEQNLDATASSAEFTGLADDYSMYAAAVKSVFEYEGDTTYSVFSEKIFVDPKEGSSQLSVADISASAEPSEWYSIDGRRLNGPEAGLCIVKYTDGSVRKVLVGK